jgi:4-amino-4-deoxy-L-arabinose transferase-like glycosyltransferase
MYPPLAMLVGYYLDKAWAEERYRALKGSAIIFGVVASFLIAGLFYAGRVVTAELMFSVKVIAGILSLLTVFVLFQSFRHNFRAVFVSYILGMIVFTAFLMTQTLPLVTPGVSVKQFVNECKQYYDGQIPVYVAKFYRPGFMYYSGIAGTELDSDKLEATVLDKTGKAYFIVQKKKYEKLSPAIQSKLRVLTVQEDKVFFVRD